ncbi:MAG: CPBP family intramembrane metalloprotease [Bacteroidales bacterium]|nr:CPBP family intramembrane metalloprotease [Bacteroidales bacterium]
MFSPWTKGLTNFWLTMSGAAVVLTLLALAFLPERSFKIERPLLQLAGGIALAFALWGIFWIGDKASAWLFDFARPEVDSIYSMKSGLPVPAIAALLLLVIGPAEEFFWRGYVQRTFAGLFAGRKYPADLAFLATALIYALVHIWSLNFMLIMAALVAGCVWGFIYRLCPKALPALVLSHALWDALVFVLLPI